MRQSSAPVNPTTPNVRQDFDSDRHHAFQKLRMSLELIDRTIRPDEIPLKSLVSKMMEVAVGLIDGKDPQAIIQSVTASLASGMTPPGATPAAPPAAPMGPTAGAPPQPPVMPGGPAGAPVSPGTLPG
jgi:hypothetical protein